MPEGMSERMSEQMPECMPKVCQHRCQIEGQTECQSNSKYTRERMLEQICNAYFQMVCQKLCQKLCQNSVSGSEWSLARWGISAHRSVGLSHSTGQLFETTRETACDWVSQNCFQPKREFPAKLLHLCGKAQWFPAVLPWREPNDDPQQLVKVACVCELRPSLSSAAAFDVWQAWDSRMDPAVRFAVSSMIWNHGSSGIQLTP